VLRRSIRRHLGRVTVLCALGLAACTGGSDSGLDLPDWSVVEELRIGSVSDPNRMLSTVGAVAVDGSDNIYVAQPQLGTIRVFDDGGAAVRDIGRRGQAPGDFERVYSIGFLADTLYAIDLGHRRISYFSLDGEHLRSTDVSPPPVSPPFFPSMPFAVFPDGSMAIGTAFPANIPAEELRRVPQLLIDRSGEVLDTVTWIGYERTGRRAPYEGRPLGVGSPLSDDAFAIFADDGSRVATMDRTVAPGPGPASFGVTMSGSDGDTIYSRRYEYTPRPIDANVIDSIVVERAILLSGAFPEPGEAQTFVRSTMFLPVYFPPVSTARFSASGDLWVRREEISGQDQIWMVLDRDGEPIASAMLPEILQVMVIRDDTIWGLEVDALGVSYVVRYRVMRDSAAE
jgi:hypothetical protein